MSASSVHDEIEAVTAKLYGPGKPGEDLAASGEPADALYGSSTQALRSTYEPALRGSLDALADLDGLDDGERQRLVESTAELFDDARIAPAEAASLHALIARQVKAGPVDAETLSEWTRQSRDQLRERYGTSANARLEAAQQFVSNRPELEAMLRSSGLGSHPELVLALAERAHSLRVKPRARR